VLVGAAGVACTDTDVDLVIGVAGCVCVLVTVCAVGGAVLVSVLVFPGPVMLETALLASLTALEATLLADPDPQALSSAVTPPSASIPSTNETRRAEAIASDLRAGGDLAQWGRAGVRRPAHTTVGRRDATLWVI
jgi:hypothetical protein